MSEREILRATMTDSGSFFRKVWRNGGWNEKQIYAQLPCALSRSPQAATPTVRGAWEDMGECSARLALFLPAGTVLQPGDRGEIIRQGQVYRGICGPCMAYPSHCYTMLLVQEVRAV